MGAEIRIFVNAPPPPLFLRVKIMTIILLLTDTFLINQSIIIVKTTIDVEILLKFNSHFRELLRTGFSSGKLFSAEFKCKSTLIFCLVSAHVKFTFLVIGSISISFALLFLIAFSKA